MTKHYCVWLLTAVITTLGMVASSSATVVAVDPTFAIVQNGNTVGHVSFDIDNNDDVTNVTGTVNGNPVTGGSGSWGGISGGYFDFQTSAGTFQAQSQSQANVSVEFPNGTIGKAVVMPEASTWTLMLLGFVGLGAGGYRAARKYATVAT